MLLLTPPRAQPSLICMVMSECASACVCVHGEARVQKVILISLQLVNVCEGQAAQVIVSFFKMINILDGGSLVR